MGKTEAIKTTSRVTSPFLSERRENPCKELQFQFSKCFRIVVIAYIEHKAWIQSLLWEGWNIRNCTSSFWQPHQTLPVNGNSIVLKCSSSNLWHTEFWHYKNSLIIRILHKIWTFFYSSHLDFQLNIYIVIYLIIARFQLKKNQRTFFSNSFLSSKYKTKSSIYFNVIKRIF